MSRVYRATFACTGTNSRLIQPSLHYQTDVPPLGDEPDPQDVAAGIWSLLGTNFLACTPASVTVHDLVVTEQVVPPAVGVAGDHSVGSVGTMTSGTDDWIPDGLVGLINIHTNTRSRSARGWMHMPSPRYSSFLSENSWSGGIVTAWNAFAALLDNSFDLGSITPTHVNPVVYSRTRHKLLEDPYTFRVTAATLNLEPKWLRSRMSAP